MKQHYAFAALATLSLGVALPALAASPSTPTPGAPGTRDLSIGLFPALRPLALIRAEHWLEHDGYKVQWHEFLAGIPPEAAAMAAGSLDFGEADTSGIEQVASHSPGVMWYVGNGAMNYVALIAAKDSPVKSVADLKGRKVGGVAPNTAPTAVLQMAMQKASLTLKDIQGYNTTGPTEPAALARGAFDAVITYAPYSAEMLTNGTGRLITTASQVYGQAWPGGGIIVRPAFAKAHPDVVVALMGYVQRAENLLRDHPQDAYKALAEGTRTSLANVEYCYTHKLVQLPASVVPDEKAMIAQATILKKFGVIKTADVAGFIKDLVHPEFAARAVGK
ncbi:MAG: ABC transporter substrate-binding protein [Hyphomicrobiales bacterium]|nr:ABC transporter substrate-binding protein [Hyphomicrobiales bacterium]